MSSRIGYVMLLALTALMQAVAARAEGVLDHVPADAMGIAIVRNLEATDEKIQRVVSIFDGLSEVKPPAPLAFVKSATGIGEGLNPAGDALLALLPGDAGPMAPKPLLLVPVTDYEKFASSINGDATGEICRVTIAGEEVLVGKKGDYALLMNLEHRPTMETLLMAPTAPSPALAELDEWLASNDVALVILPPGLDALTSLGQAGLAEQRAQVEQQLSDPQFADMLRNAKLGIDMYDAVLGFLGAEVSAGGVAVGIDNDSNLRISDRLLLERDGKAAAMDDVPAMSKSPLTGFPDQPFVVAGGGPLPKAWGDVLATMVRNILTKMPEVYGFEQFGEAEWKQVEESWRESMQIESLGLVWYTGQKGDPLFSNIFDVMQVADADRYLAAARESVELWNQLTVKSASDVKAQYEVSDAEIAGKKGLLMAVDVSAAAADENVPMLGPMWESMFGAEGKMRMYYVPADAKNVIMAISDEGRAAQIVGSIAAGEQGLVQSDHVATTTTLLNPAAPWAFYVSPQGYAAWLDRFFSDIAAKIGEPVMTIPPYPAGPPLGFSMNLTGGQFHGEMVVPAQALRDLAAYIKTANQ